MKMVGILWNTFLDIVRYLVVEHGAVVRSSGLQNTYLRIVHIVRYLGEALML
jgi:hypothetical protein